MTMYQLINSLSQKLGEKFIYIPGKGFYYLCGEEYVFDEENLEITKATWEQLDRLYNQGVENKELEDIVEMFVGNPEALIPHLRCFLKISLKQFISRRKEDYYGEHKTYSVDSLPEQSMGTAVDHNPSSSENGGRTAGSGLPDQKSTGEIPSDDTDVRSGGISGSPIGEKRGRGRPKKMIMLENKLDPKIKRPRGRPKGSKDKVPRKTKNSAAKISIDEPKKKREKEKSQVPDQGNLFPEVFGEFDQKLKELEERANATEENNSPNNSPEENLPEELPAEEIPYEVKSNGEDTIPEGKDPVTDKDMRRLRKRYPGLQFDENGMAYIPRENPDPQLLEAIDRLQAQIKEEKDPEKRLRLYEALESLKWLVDKEPVVIDRDYMPIPSGKKNAIRQPWEDRVYSTSKKLKDALDLVIFYGGKEKAEELLKNGLLPDEHAELIKFYFEERDRYVPADSIDSN